MDRSTAKLVNRLTAMLVNCLTATLVNRLTAKLVVVNLVKLHLTELNCCPFCVPETNADLYMRVDLKLVIFAKIDTPNMVRHFVTYK